MGDTKQATTRPPFAVVSIVFSMGLMAVGNGHLFAYVPVRLAAGGFEPWIASAMVAALGVGSCVGCVVAGYVVRRVGPARAYAAFSAMVILGILMIALAVNPYLWIASRLVYGVSAAGFFIVTQSWLNDASPNEWRGRVIGAFYMIYVIGIGIGGYILRFVDLESADAPLVSIFFTAAGMLPICLTRLPAPPPPASIAIAFRAVWNISPVGIVGMLAVGGLTMLVQGFTPIYVANEGYSQADVGLLVLLMQFGMIGVQFPLGALSDRVDRRYVLLLACLIIIISAWIASGLNLADFWFVALIFAIWAGASEGIYSVANAHANDRAEPQYYVSLSSTMLITWSVSGAIFPGIGTILTSTFGPTAYIDMVIVIAILYALFVLFRITRRESVPSDETVNHQQISAQAPYPAELSPQLDDDVRSQHD